jgi:hypothetical protein
MNSGKLYHVKLQAVIELESQKVFVQRAAVVAAITGFVQVL